MTEPNQAAGAIAPAAAATSTSAPNGAQPQGTAAPATPAAGAAPEPKVGDPDWLNGRIAKAKQSAERELLKTLGVTSADEARAAIEAAKAKADADKTAEQRALELKAKFDAESARATEQAKIIGEYAARQMIGLTAEQQAAVKAIAGEDAGKQLSAIAALQPTWTKAAPAAVAASSPATTAAPVAPDTAPGHTAPAGGTASPPNHRAVYEQMRAQNPFAAADYALQHEADVFKAAG